MLGDKEFVFGLIAVVCLLFASNRVRLDVVAWLALLALLLRGILTVEESLAGFGNSVVILVAGLLVIGETLQRTGVAQGIGSWILRVGGDSQARLIVLIMLAAGLLSSVMSSTAVVAIFIPILLKIASKTQLTAAQLMMPMSFAAMISGMISLIATPPNLVISSELEASGHQPLGFFSFTLIGITVLAIAIVYFLLLGKFFLPHNHENAKASLERKSIGDLSAKFGFSSNVYSLSISGSSSLKDQTIAEAGIYDRYRVRIIGVHRKHTRNGSFEIINAEPEVKLVLGDVLICIARPMQIADFEAKEKLAHHPLTEDRAEKVSQQIGAAVMMMHPESRHLGKSVRNMEFRSKYGVHVQGIRRGKKVLDNFVDTELVLADMLLIVGDWDRIESLIKRPDDFILLELPREYDDLAPARSKATTSILILSSMVLLSVLNVIPLVAVVILAVLAAVFTRCLTMEQAYRSIHWSTIVLLAGMLPLAKALEKTGGINLIVDSLTAGIGSSGPLVMMTLLFVLTASLSLFLSNTATAVLMSPVAIQIAEQLEVSPYPLAMMVLIGASAAYASPVSSPVVTLVVEPGGYRFTDFLKAGLPLMLITYLVAIFLVPLLFPL